MAINKSSRRVLLLKVIILVVGIVLMGLGLYAHFQSSWRKYEVYKMCELLEKLPGSPPCPSISMEETFVAVIIVCCVISLASLVGSIMLQPSQIRIADVVYHVIAGVCLVVAGVLFIISAEQINNMAHLPEVGRVKFLRTEKLVAGTLCTLQSILYGAATIIILKS